MVAPMFDDAKSVSVLSGGLDSTILTYLLVKQIGPSNVIALSFQYGQRHDIEIENAKVTCQKLGIEHRILDISFLGEVVSKVSALSNTRQVDMPSITDVLGHPQPPTYVPYRNMILNAIAMSFAESNQCRYVYSGLQCQDQYAYWDTSEAFVQAMNEVSGLNRTSAIELKAPFAGMSKADEIHLALNIDVPFEDTWTCYTGPDANGAACGKCPSCAERIQNFIKAKVKDPVPYAIEIDWDTLCAE